MAENQGVMTLSEIDREIAALTAERERVVALMRDPKQRVARRGRCEPAFARWVEKRGLSPADLEDVRDAAHPDDRWLFDEEFLEADGWTIDGESHFWPPVDPNPGSAPSAKSPQVGAK